MFAYRDLLMLPPTANKALCPRNIDSDKWFPKHSTPWWIVDPPAPVYDQYGAEIPLTQLVPALIDPDGTPQNYIPPEKK